jgi:hypothetical protein
MMRHLKVLCHTMGMSDMKRLSVGGVVELCVMKFGRGNGVDFDLTLYLCWPLQQTTLRNKHLNLPINIPSLFGLVVSPLHQGTYA